MTGSQGTIPSMRDMPDQQFYVRVRGKVTGPFGVERLRQLRARGQLGRFHELSEDRVSWQPAASVYEVFPPEEFAKRVDDEQELPESSGISPGPPEQAWYYMDARGSPQGPLSRAILVSLVQAGTIEDATLVWNAAMTEWSPLRIADPSLLSVPASMTESPTHAGGPSLKWEETVGWRRVRTGTTLSLVAAFLTIGSWCLFGLVLLLLVIGDSRSVVPAVALLTILAWAVSFAGKTVEAVSYGFFAACPPGSAGRGSAVASLALAVTNLCLIPVVFLLASAADLAATTRSEPLVRDPTSQLLALLQVLSLALVVTATFLILLFLRGTALRFRTRGLAQGILYLSVLYGVYVFLIFLSAVVMIFMFQAALAAGQPLREVKTSWSILGVVFSLILAAGLAWQIWYIVTLFQLRQLLSAAVSQR